MAITLMCDGKGCAFTFKQGDRVLEIKVKEKVWTGRTIKEDTNDRPQFFMMCPSCGKEIIRELVEGMR